MRRIRLVFRLFRRLNIFGFYPASSQAQAEKGNHEKLALHKESLNRPLHARKLKFSVHSVICVFTLSLMKLRLILILISLFIFGGGLAAGILWNKENRHEDWAPFGSQEEGEEPAALPVPAEIVEEFSRQFSALHIADQPQQLSGPLVFSGKDGKPRKLSDFYGGAEGNYLLLNFWATWCAPCVLELPSLGRLKEAYRGKGLDVLALSIDHSRNLEEIGVFLDTRGIGDYAYYLDQGRQVRRVLPMRGIPTSFLIDPQGRVLYIFEGDTDWAAPPARVFFDALLSSKQ